MSFVKKRAREGFLLGLALFYGVALSSCASTRMGDSKTDALFRSGDYLGAAERLEKGLEGVGVDGRDGLLYLLDLGLSYHSAGKYEESNRYFLLADRVAEIKDYTSLSTEAATLLTSDQIKQYKGEEFENVLISVYLAMNFAMMGDIESALVEARRVNTKLYRMISEGKRKYQQNAFARYLSAILYEADRNWNDAYVAYKLTAELMPDFPLIGRDLWALASKMGNRSDLDRWEKKYKLSESEKQDARKRVSRARPAEIIVIYQNGISPRKIPDPGFHSVPRFVPRFNPVSKARIRVEAGSGDESASGETEALMDIESVAIQNLQEKWGGLIAKKMAGFVAKQAIGGVIDSKTNNSGLGTLLAFALHLSDQADTRSWNLLPKDLQIARFQVKAGTYTVHAEPLGVNSGLTPKTVQVKPGEKVFLTFRYMP